MLGLVYLEEGVVPHLHKAKRQHFEPLTRANLKAARSEWRKSPKTQFLMDANMEPWAVHVMRYKNFDVKECDLAQLRNVDDRTVFATAWKLRRLLVTHDGDFLDDRLFPFERCAGLLVLPSYGSVSMEFANLLAGASDLISRGAHLWFHTKIVARRDFTIKIRTWERSSGFIAEWDYRIAKGYRQAALCAP
ncbi:DUF5615 family PIN-like protein [Bradyrhizobium sp. SZCCHNPS2010]|uniref:DUF5615 family PIN-like protein n=1 Tax=Bradyrhizobium sp. SZCCHNPS2010 TaxID=3057333 RepID=UPI003966EEDD